MDRTLAIFGITGGTGRAVAVAARARGWRVRGLARPGSLLPPEESSAVELVRGTFADPERVCETVAGTGAVCCLIGPRPPYREVFCASATAEILRAMRVAGARRLVCQTGAMIGTAEGRSWLFERMARAFARRAPEASRDRVEQERLVQDSGLDWTIVKPPRLADGPARGRVRAGPALRVGLLSSVRRADLAAFIVDEIEEPRFAQVRVFVTG